MRASRLVSLLLLLQTRGPQTADELARELEVSTRTVYRDVEALSESGVPIYAERGPGGGIRLVDGYRTRLTGLTTEEADSLFLSGLPGPAAELGLGTVVAAARLKVLAALPPELRTRASRISQRFHFDAPGWFRSGSTPPHLEGLARAVWENRAVDIVYRREGKPVSRRLEPLGLVLKAGTWYLVARAAGGGTTRTYRVSRVMTATVLEERFERPDGFDLGAYWSESIMAYERDMPRYAITVRLAPKVWDQVADRLSEEFLRTSQRLPDPDGRGDLLRLTFDWDDQAEIALFQLGSLVELVEPVELRGRLIERARSILEQYEPVASA